MIPIEIRDTYTLEDIRDALKGIRHRIYKGSRIRFRQFSDSKNGMGSSISFLNPGRENEAIKGFSCMYVVAKKVKSEKTLIVTPNPKLAYIKILNHCMSLKPTKTFIHPSAVIHPDAYIGEGVIIEPLCVVGVARIGEGSLIKAGAKIKDNVYIGRNVTIGENTVIGSDGFGYEWDGKKYEKFMSIGSVYIGDNVDIGANTCIDRGTLSDTLIYSGVKIDNLVHIAHNVNIEENSLVIANSMIGGSVKIGKRAYIAPSSTIINQATIADSAMVGIGSNVLKDIPVGETWVGNPAKKLR